MAPLYQQGGVFLTTKRTKQRRGQISIFARRLFSFRRREKIEI